MVYFNGVFWQRQRRKPEFDMYNGAKHQSLGHVCSMSGIHLSPGSLGMHQWYCGNRINNFPLAFTVLCCYPFCFSFSAFNMHVIKHKSQVDGTRVSQLALCWRGAIHWLLKTSSSRSLWTDLWHYWWAVPAGLKHMMRANAKLVQWCVAEQLGKSWEHWVIKRVPSTAILSIMSFEFPLWF